MTNSRISTHTTPGTVADTSAPPHGATGRDHGQTPSVEPGAATRLARVLTEVFAPSVIIVALFAVIGARHGLAGLIWAAVGAASASLGPMSIIITGVIRGRYTDHHLTVREHRVIPLTVTCILVVTGLVTFTFGGAPAELITVQAVMLGGVVVCGPITYWFKISFHTAVATAAGVVLITIDGPWFALTLLLIAAIAWSRVRLNHHTVAQVTLGVPVGATVAVAAYLLTT